MVALGESKILFVWAEENLGRSESRTPIRSYESPSQVIEQERFRCRRMKSKPKDLPSKSHFVLGSLSWIFLQH